MDSYFIPAMQSLLIITFFFSRCLVNVYKLEVFKDSIKEPLNIQMSNLLKVCLERYFLNELFVSEANQ